ncbi:MAG TPA: isoprenylcysteine carboxylmethyltransferase family protein [Acidobacteriaceae bacterium]
MRANLITLAALLAAVVWLVLHANLVEWTPVKVAGAVLAGASIVMLVVARLQLGSAFSVKAKASSLVTTGLYARIRNPIYVFGALALLGMAVVLGNWVLLVLVVLLAPIQVVRARKEEAVLSAAFGEEYERYKAGTWF